MGPTFATRPRIVRKRISGAYAGYGSLHIGHRNNGFVRRCRHDGRTPGRGCSGLTVEHRRLVERREGRHSRKFPNHGSPGCPRGAGCNSNNGGSSQTILRIPNVRHCIGACVGRPGGSCLRIDIARVVADARDAGFASAIFRSPSNYNDVPISCGCDSASLRWKSLGTAGCGLDQANLSLGRKQKSQATADQEQTAVYPQKDSQCRAHRDTSS